MKNRRKNRGRENRRKRRKNKRRKKGERGKREQEAKQEEEEQDGEEQKEDGGGEGSRSDLPVVLGVLLPPEPQWERAGDLVAAWWRGRSTGSTIPSGTQSSGCSRRH